MLLVTIIRSSQQTGINVELGGLQDQFGAPMNEMTSLPSLPKIPTKLGHDITMIYGETSEERIIT